MKVVKYIVWGIVIFLGVFYVLPASLLQIPYIQKQVSKQVVRYLEDRFHTPVQISQVEFELFNKLIIKDIYLEDQAGDTLFQAKRLAAGFEFLPLLKGRFRFDSVQLFTFQLNLSKETDDSPLNIQYIIDAFSNPDTLRQETPIDLQINNLNLRLGNFSYRIKNARETPYKFNLKDIALRDISSKIHVKSFDKNELNFAIDRLSFRDQSGFQVKKVALDFSTTQEETKIEKLLIELNRSSILITDIIASYNDTGSGYQQKNIRDINNININLNQSDIYLIDLGAFLTGLSQYHDKATIEGHFSGSPDDLSLDNFYFRDYNRFMLKATANIKNLLSDSDKIYVRGTIEDSFFSPEGIERLANNFSRNPVNLPIQIENLENVRFKGEVQGYLDNLNAAGFLNTGIGTLQANLNIGEDKARFIKGYLGSDSLNIGKLMNSRKYGDIVFEVNLDAKEDQSHQYAGIIDANIKKFVYQGYAYNNLSLNGEFSPNSFKGLLDLDSPDGKISAEGLVALNGANSEFNFTAKAEDLKPDKLNLTNKYKNPLLSFFLDANFTGNNVDNIMGSLAVSNLSFETDKGSYTLDTLSIYANQNESEKISGIRSPIINGEICGIYSFNTLIPALKETFSFYLPSLIPSGTKYIAEKENNFSINLTIEDISKLTHILELPFSFDKQSKINGQYDNIADIFDLEVDIPQASVSGNQIRDTHISLEKQEGNAQLLIEGINWRRKNSQLKFAANLHAANDMVNATVNWRNDSSHISGSLLFDALFSKPNKQSALKTEIDIRQSELMFNNSLWTLYPSGIVIDSSAVKINYLAASYDDQRININGAVSQNPDEEITVELNKVDLEYIFRTLDIKALEFGGLATGFVNAQDIYKTRKLSTHLDVKDFSFNQVTFGDLDLVGDWDDENQGILMEGFIYKNDSTTVDVNGIIYPVKEELSIDFIAENADARFLRKYLKNVVQDLTGDISGQLRLIGDLNNPTVEGKVLAKNCRFGIEFLNTYYTFTDSVTCLPNEIQARNLILHDVNGNTAVANGYVKHNLFDDFQFSAHLSFNDFMVLNTNKYLNPLFYGMVYGSGTASLSGTEDIVNIDVSMRNTENTQLSLNFMEEADIAEYDFIHFIDKEKDSIPVESTIPQLASSQPIYLNTNSETEIRFNLNIDATPQASIEMIMDPITGDRISGYGSGNLQMSYGTKVPLKVIGEYNIEKGKYNFIFQQALFRNFDIQEGSKVIFRGDPYTAGLDIHAAYTVSANLGDLDQQLLNLSARNNVPVNCILIINGPLNQPTISFDLDLPGATAELNRQVKSYIRTEDMMSRQIVYLLVLGRFYTSPEYTGDSRINNDYSFLTSTLSNQISNILGTLSENIQIGTRFHYSEGVQSQSSTEVEVLLSSQLLNNRLIINGNFGYVDNPYINGGNQDNVPLVGDFDLEYKLTSSGDIRLKGFNHYNYRNYYSLTPQMTQGIGILFRKDFDRIGELFGRKKRNPLTEKEKENKEPADK